MKYTTQQILANAVLEVLEDRRLCSTVSLDGEVLTLQGDASTPCKFMLDSTNNGQSLKVYVTNSGGTQYFPTSVVKQIRIVGGSQANYVYISTKVSINSNINTGAGNDTIVGGSGDDTIDAGDGNNYVDGRRGNDQITAGNGNNTLYGGDGNDTLIAGDGNSFLAGSGGDDNLSVGNGHSTLAGESGNDTLSAGDGSDLLRGGLGNDRLVAGIGNTTLRGDSGNDTLVADPSKQTIIPGYGTDTIETPDTGNTGNTGNTSGNTAGGTDTGGTGTSGTGTSGTGTGGTGTGGTGSTGDTGTGGTNTGGSTGTGGTDQGANLPAPVITTIETSVSSGHAFHVHALDSKLGAGSDLDARFEWDFGDTGGRYNKLVGFNAAHFYDQPGSYSIILKITNKLGKSASTTLNINVTADTRQFIYVDSNGNDTNTGLSADQAICSIARANQLIGDDTTVLFNRGGTYDITTTLGGLRLVGNNILVGAYGTGDLPIIRRTGSVDAGGGSLIMFNDADQDITVQDLKFVSTITTGTEKTNRPTALMVRGTNIAVRGCTIDNMGDFVNAQSNPKGLMVQDNTSPSITGLTGYFVWLAGPDVVVLGNQVANSTREHDIRSSSDLSQRVLIAHNDLTNLDRTSVDGGDQRKTTIDIRAGSYVYVFDNTLDTGAVAFGPSGGAGWMADSANVQWIVADGNFIHNAQLSIDPNCWNLTVRNNVLDRVDGEQITIVPTRADAPSRYLSNINIENNTGINMTTSGKFLKVYSQSAPGSISVKNNLFIAPNLRAGGAAIDVRASDLSGFAEISHNVFPAGISGASGVSMVNNLNYVTNAVFEATPQVHDDVYLTLADAASRSITISGFTAGVLLAA